MTVRPAAQEDIPAIASLEAATFPSGASEPFLASLAEGAGAVLAAAEGGALLGYAWYQLVLDEGYVGNVAVAESCRRQGVGTALVRAMLADAGERGAAFLTHGGEGEQPGCPKTVRALRVPDRRRAEGLL